jgi:transposase-like protein
VNAIKEKFAKLHALGWSYKEIAAALGVTDRALYKWRKELKLPRRARGRRKSPEIR